MKKTVLLSLLLLTAVCFWSGTVFANAGVFRGNGANIQMGQTADIQMVEEVVTMIPQRGNYPVSSNGRNLDQMLYHCVFKLRNLSDKDVTVQVGFPLASDAVRYGTSDDKLDQTVLGATYNFFAGTKDKIYPVRFVPYDKEKKFSRLFLWDMTFAPKEEIELRVIYRMGGFMALGGIQRDRKASRNYQCPYLRGLETVIGQGHRYVTETGGCWAGQIEKATFRIHYADFEEYLNKRGMFDQTDEDIKKAEADKAKLIAEGRFSRALRCKTKTAPPVRIWEPAFDEWKEIRNSRGRAYCREKVYAPFDTKKTKYLDFCYAFCLGMPVTAEDFDLLLKILEKQNERNENKAELSEIERNTADAVLEFYGVRTGNEKIRDFLKNQMWYPVKNPPAIDPALKARLQISKY